MTGRAEWNEYVQGLHLAADRPPSRTIAGQIGRSHMPVNDVLQGHRMTSWAIASAVLQALDPEFDREYAKTLWANASLDSAPHIRPSAFQGDAAARIALALERIADALEGPRPEWECPNCNAVTRARMADK